jgi:hypothetical protein
MSVPQCPTCGASLDGPLWQVFEHLPVCRTPQRLHAAYRARQAVVVDMKLARVGIHITRGDV